MPLMFCASECAPIKQNSDKGTCTAGTAVVFHLVSTVTII